MSPKAQPLMSFSLCRPSNMFSLVPRQLCQRTTAADSEKARSLTKTGSWSAPTRSCENRARLYGRATNTSRSSPHSAYSSHTRIGPQTRRCPPLSPAAWDALALGASSWFLGFQTKVPPQAPSGFGCGVQGKGGSGQGVGEG
jgi:hypothetical protein